MQTTSNLTDDPEWDKAIEYVVDYLSKSELTPAQAEAAIRIGVVAVREVEHANDKP